MYRGGSRDKELERRKADLVGGEDLVKGVGGDGPLAKIRDKRRSADGRAEESRHDVDLVLGLGRALGDELVPCVAGEVALEKCLLCAVASVYSSAHGE